MTPRCAGKSRNTFLINNDSTKVFPLPGLAITTSDSSQSITACCSGVVIMSTITNAIHAFEKKSLEYISEVQPMRHQQASRDFFYIHTKTDPFELLFYAE